MLALLMRADVRADKVFADRQLEHRHQQGRSAARGGSAEGQRLPARAIPVAGRNLQEGRLRQLADRRAGARLLRAIAGNCHARCRLSMANRRPHLSLPERDILDDQPKPASASVFIKHRPDAKIGNHVAEIKALVVNSVQGLPYDNVTVTLFPARHSNTGVRIAAMPHDWKKMPPGWPAACSSVPEPSSRRARRPLAGCARAWANSASSREKQRQQEPKPGPA